MRKEKRTPAKVGVRKMRIRNEQLYLIGIISLIVSLGSSNLFGSFFLFILGTILTLKALIRDHRRRESEKRENLLESFSELTEIVSNFGNRLCNLENKLEEKKNKLEEKKTYNHKKDKRKRK